MRMSEKNKIQNDVGGSRSQTWHLKPPKRIVICNLKGDKLAAVQGVNATERDGGDDSAVE